MLIEFNKRIEDLEVRSCNKNLLSDLPHTTAEIVKWKTDKDNIEFCYTVAHWKLHKEGDFDLNFTSNRFLEVESNLLIYLMKYGQKELDNQSELLNL